MGGDQRLTSVGGVSPGRQGGQFVEMQRRRLLSAVVEVVAEHGLEDAHVGRMCARAGVSRRTFYDLFEDREACFLAAFELGIERLAQRVVPAYERAGRWRERIRSALVVLLEAFEDDPGLAWLCLVETLKGRPPVLERRQAVLGVLFAAVEEGRKESRGGGEPPSLTAESVVGGGISVVHARLIARDTHPLIDLVNPLMGMIVLPYLGSAASRKELRQSVSRTNPAGSSNCGGSASGYDPFKDLPIRITFRTARVLVTIAEQPSASNRVIAESAGVRDQGQMSKLLRRLADSGLIENHGEGSTRGEPNAWRITQRGEGILQAVAA